MGEQAESQTFFLGDDLNRHILSMVSAPMNVGRLSPRLQAFIAQFLPVQLNIFTGALLTEPTRARNYTEALLHSDEVREWLDSWSEIAIMNARTADILMGLAPQFAARDTATADIRPRSVDKSPVPLKVILDPGVLEGAVSEFVTFMQAYQLKTKKPTLADAQYFHDAFWKTIGKAIESTPLQELGVGDERELKNRLRAAAAKSGGR